MLQSPITLEALIVLDAIDNRGSFAAAAEQLNKVPSALSYIVQKLEEQLSVTLFVRQGRRSVLTPAGRHLLEEGRKLLGAVSKITEQTQTISHGWEPAIRIAYDSIYDVNQLMSVLSVFLTSHPNIEIDLCEEVMNGAWEALMTDKVDLLIGAPGPVPNYQGIRTIKMETLEQVLVVPKSHPLTKLGQLINEEDIAEYRTVVVHDSAKSEIPWSSNIIEQSQRIYVTTIEQKIAAIRAGIGVGFLPRERVCSYIENGELETVTVNSQDKREAGELYLAWKTVNKGKGLQALTSLILDKAK